jgi:glutamate/tyrosine decarboxylase-like PLP-dependent enzyme
MEEVHFCDLGVQLSRAFRALKLWMSFKTFGAAAFREAVARGFHLARFAAEELVRAGCWELAAPAGMAIVAFRYVEPGRAPEELESINRRLAPEMLAEGYAAVSSTVLNGRTALRLCTINPRTQEDEIAETVRRLGAAARRL